MKKTTFACFGIAMSLILIAVGFGSGFFLGRNTANQPLTGLPTSQDQPAVSLSPLPAEAIPTSPADVPADLFDPFWEIWQLVHENYVDQPLDDLTLMRGAINGMLATLGDQHTSYMEPQEYSDAIANLSGEYEGIGAWVNTDGDYLTVVEPMPGSPAEKAGLKPGDKIIAIDGEDMTGIDPELARLHVLGPKSTTVVLTVEREGEAAPFDVSIQRATIVVPSVESRMLEGDIAYIRLFTFGDKTNGELRTALTDLMAQNPKGMVLDLRNNTGGALNTAIYVVSQFIDEGVVMYEEYGDGERDVYNSQGNGLATDIPLVVLVNEWTASASEIVAGAIQDYDRGVLVGVPTFGKGSVQSWIPLADEQGAVRITIARWLTPNERQIHEIGLTPDVILAVFTPEQWENEPDLAELGVTEEQVIVLTAEEVKAERDPMLEKAVEILLEQ